MVRFSLNELTTYRWSFEQDVANYKAAGFHALGVWRQKLSDYGEEKGVELLAESGLAVSNLLWAGGFTGSDGRSYADSVADAADAIRLAGVMHSPCLVVYGGGRGGHTRKHARRLLLSALRELSPLAEEENVALALEPMHPACAAECTFLTSLQETLAILDEVANPFVKLAFDTFHLAQDVCLESLQQIADRIAVVHLGDSREPPTAEQNRCALGSGRIRLREIISCLGEAGYDGYFDIELIGEEIETSDYQDLLRKSQEALAELVAPAGHCPP
ncbi:MAG: TIM barrel protein [Planctomycetales bacterium]|nr:TIM barrel protein [Planctomycetales bacterium]NIM10338.1 TIM barrel protein [Planctomycetales bacterium]NIN08885.1 TIM barrel protein [Planctomycetales bacterium]NIN78000.1 TIM barrel protein [Planctomycetales bacterium]NIO35188.1 TIM barrel protein [Planctomycetales bacterium]